MKKWLDFLLSHHMRFLFIKKKIVTRYANVHYRIKPKPKKNFYCPLTLAPKKRKKCIQLFQRGATIKSAKKRKARVKKLREYIKRHFIALGSIRSILIKVKKSQGGRKVSLFLRFFSFFYPRLSSILLNWEKSCITIVIGRNFR